MGILFIVFILVVFLLPTFLEYINYSKSTYYINTRFSFSSVRKDIGRLGEYATYKQLKSFEKNGALFLFNCYVPHNDEYAEVDLIMLYHSGIYVFESKNYSGWIFGDDKSQFWTQSLKSGKNSVKERFYNPIKQNDGHIKVLREFLGDYQYNSFIVFSNRCEFKKLDNKRDDVCVIHRQELEKYISRYNDNYRDILSRVDIVNIYNKLYPYTQMSDDVKNAHVNRVKR